LHRRISLRLAWDGAGLFQAASEGLAGTGWLDGVCAVFFASRDAASAPAKGTLILYRHADLFLVRRLAQTLMAVAAVVMVAKVIDLTLWQGCQFRAGQFT
jgi:hypothetical protein